MPAPRHSTGASSGALYYAAIDGTGAEDSAAFGALLEEHRGWRNLLSVLEKAPPTPSEPRRLVDRAHPFLPIYRASAKGRRVSVICPGGIGGIGLDSFWRNVADSYRVRTRPPVVGRHAAAERSAALMNDFILRPELRYTVDAQNVTHYHLADPVLANPGASHGQASLLYVSSHGWLGGFMAGNQLEESTAVTPAEAQSQYPPSAYFLVGRAAAEGKGFHGPRWIVLAQCSTVNSATWPLWAHILAKSSPHVRGILAYEEVSPAAGPAANIAENFFSKLKHMPLLDAWIAAHPRRTKWAAIVHRDARYDRLKDFPSFRPFADVSTTATQGNYLGFLRSSPAGGEPILDLPAPFGLQLEHIRRGTPHEILPENLDRSQPLLLKDSEYRIAVTTPPREEIRGAKLTLVHIRLTYKPQLSWSRVFPALVHGSELRVGGFQTKTLDIAPTRPTPSLAFKVAPTDLENSGLMASHSYLWLRINLSLASGATLNHDFKTKGFLY